MIPVYRIPDGRARSRACGSASTIRRPAKVVIKSFHTACDTRHNINNSNFIRGCHDYFMWTGDYHVSARTDRPRPHAMRFIMREFDTRQAQVRLHDLARPRRPQRRALTSTARR